MHRLESLSPLGMLQEWGLRVSGGGYTDPLRKAVGGSLGIDDEMALAMWVEATEGFETSRPVLTHVYVRFLPVENYRYREPGETRLRAAIRHGQAHLMLEGWKDTALGQKLHDDFMDALIRRQRENPFKVPPRPEESTIETIVAAVESEVEYRNPRALAS